MEIHSNNKFALTLAGHKSYDLTNNSGRVTIGSHCIVICDNNTGHIFMGSDCKVLNCSGNREFISVGSNSVVEKAQNNAGQLEIGSRSVVKDINHNNGTITIGNYCKIPATFHGNCGKINMGEHCETLAAVVEGWGSVAGSAPVPAPRPAVSPRRSPLPVQPFVPGMAAAPAMGFVAPPGSAGVTGPPYPTTPTCSPHLPYTKMPQPQPHGHIAHDMGHHRLCTICMVRKRDIAFNCGHLACESCGHAMVKCHTCNVVITQKLKLHNN